MRYLQAARGASLNNSGQISTPKGIRRETGLLALAALLVLAVDLISKSLVVATLAGRAPVRLLGGAVYLVAARNTGAAFSLAEGWTVVLTAIAVAVVVAIVRTASRLRSVRWAICLGLILGGALGNLADRIFRAPGPFRGAVVDWISLFDDAGRVWPVFNLADASLVVGVALAVLLELRGIRIEGTRAARRGGD